MSAGRVASAHRAAAGASLRASRPVRALSKVWPAFLVSRVLVWGVGVIAAVVRHSAPADDPPGVTAHLGHTTNVIVASAVRWDAVWYVAIAEHGYTSAHETSFFPLYPLTMRLVAAVVRSEIVAGVVLSMVACLAALSILYALAELDLGPRVASATVWLVALFPMSLFLSAVYTESLFLALSAGSIYAARRGRWLSAAALGALAAASRSVGLLLLVPLAWLAMRERDVSSRRSALATLALVPCGMLAYIVALGLDRGTPFAMFNARSAHRGFVLAPATVVRQFEWSYHRVRTLLHAGHHGLALLSSGLPEIAFLALALTCTAGVIRRLDRVYAAYVVAVLAVLLCEPEVGGQPLTSFPRYVLVLFPLWTWLALALSERGWWRPLLGASAALLALFTAQFAAWQFVA